MGPNGGRATAATAARGLRSFSVSGRVREPGVKLAPAGITVRELDRPNTVAACADGHVFTAYLPGGASGGILPASMADIPLDFGTLEKYGCFIGSAAIVVLSDKDDLRAAALNLMRFFEDESCGQCTPCRVGTQKARMLMERPDWDRPLLDELSQVMRDASICGLGQAAPNPLTCVVRYFPQLSKPGMPRNDGCCLRARRHGCQRPSRTKPSGRSRSASARIFRMLCFRDAPGYRPDGNCRACMVEIEGERVLAASCMRRPASGMRVRTATARAEKARALVLELLVADQPERAQSHDPDSAFYRQVDEMGLDGSRFPAAERWAADASHPAMRVNLDACIQCGLCVRACREVQVNDVIGMAFRNAEAKIVFDFDDPMGPSTCVACGECVQACPTGALMPSAYLDDRQVRTVLPDRKVDSLCPYCGVGCQVTYAVKDERIVYADGKDGPANRNRLCVKGRFGFDYIHHPHRLTKPLVRLPRCQEGRKRPGRSGQSMDAFPRGDMGGGARPRRRRPRRHPRRSRPKALAGFGSAKGSNEEAYLFQKLVRTGFGSNNVDHCTRLCHASSVAALMEGLEFRRGHSAFLGGARRRGDHRHRRQSRR